MGNGCVIKRGSTWAAIISRTDRATGKRSRDYYSGFKTEKEAKAKLRKLLVAKDDGVYVEPHKRTVKEYVETWLREWLPNKAGRQTIERNEHAAAHIIAALGAVPIQKVTPEDINRLVRDLRQRFAPRSVRMVYRLAKRIWVHAYKHGDVRRDIFALLEAPAVPHSEAAVLKPDETQRMLDALSDAYRVLAILGLGTGMRRGEMLALRWDAVNLDRGELSVRQSLEQTRAGLRFKDPKTVRARRTISLPPSVVGALDEHRKDQLELRMKLGLGKPSADALVFCDHEGNPLRPDSVSQRFLEAMQRAGLDHVGLHTLRHTHASALLAAGEDVISVSRRLGHANAAITLNVYGHLMTPVGRAAEIAEGLFR
jgi:integrase